MGMKLCLVVKLQGVLINNRGGNFLGVPNRDAYALCTHINVGQLLDLVFIFCVEITRLAFVIAIDLEGIYIGFNDCKALVNGIGKKLAPSSPKELRPSLKWCRQRC